MKSIDKFRKMMVVIYLFTGITFIIINIFVIGLANNFAEKYGATRYEIGYHEVKGITTGRDGLEREGKDVMVPSYFTFYTSDDTELLETKNVYSEYNDFNITVQNYYDGAKIIFAFVTGFSLFGVLFSLMSRYHSYGYIIGTILSFLIFIEVTWLNIGAYVAGVFLIISAYMVFKSRFIDYNESFLSLKWLK